MADQPFTNENEILQKAQLGEGDRSLFSKQSVHLIDNDLDEDREVQWDFILPCGKDWHFRQKVSLLGEESRLNAFKDYIRRVLMDSSRETMLVMIDGKEVYVPFRYEVETGGRMVKVPELDGEFHDATQLGESIPSFISARR
ncbi:hypothetical protein ROT99_22330 [Citrobacter freundii complex sp. 2023EL-00966]|uniref:hypothetical protein n=1 Tax=Citrobacter freundii complex sp. 2023EL-00966 TaxID=3076118 RepID=UPI002894DB42|nr:hypothetical protein [Citrobacter freundii complex sp. 2023EL-00966]MDT3755067.1 hypothetical protein [Citrobacter freundii complex sp. 2023EL-00966]